jgi:parallel beta-helix repeat protein
MYSMRRLIVELVIAILLTSSLLAVGNGVAGPNILRVPQDYSSVQAAINAANPGDTILISPATYHESVTIEKDDLAIIGASRELTVLHGDPGQPVVTIKANDVLVANLTLKFGYNGIQLAECQNCTLKNNKILNIYYYSIVLTDSIHNTIVCNNITREVGIINTLAGIRLQSSFNNVIQNNSITEVSETYAIGLFSSNNNALLDNDMANDAEGIYLFSSSGNIIEGNNAWNGRWGGIRLESSNDNSIRYNFLTQNWAAIRLINSAQNRIYHNDFVNNTIQADLFQSPGNTWDSGYPAGGNHWNIESSQDSHMGPYQNISGTDGIGDEPYVMGNENTDYYPLMGVLKRFDLGEWSNTTYFACAISNYTIPNLSLDAKHRSIEFQIEAPINTTGFYRIAIPKPVIHSSTTEWKVLINDETSNYTVTEDDATTYLFFTSSHHAQTAKITGTQTIVLPKKHEITIAEASMNATSLYLGDKLNVTVTIQNLGETNETFDISAYLNDTQISTVTVSQMAPTTNFTQTFVLDSGSIPLYTDCQIEVKAGPVPEEPSTDNNVFTKAITTKIAGDVNGDKKVNILDISLVAIAYGSTSGAPNWNPVADINGDGTINILDITHVAKEYGKTYP